MAVVTYVSTLTHLSGYENRAGVKTPQDELRLLLYFLMLEKTAHSQEA